MKFLALLLIFAVLPFALHEREMKHRSIASVQAAPSDAAIIKDSLYPRSLKEVATFGKTGNVRLFFNLPPHTNPGGLGLVPALIDHINKAQVSIRMAIFQFNHDGIFAALKKAIDRKVKIYIATDACYRRKIGYKEYFDDLQSYMTTHGQSASQVIDDDTPICAGAFNHNKYIIFDYEKGEKATAWFGSYNPTNHGSVENVELALSVRGSKIASIFKLDFDQLIAGISKSKKLGVYNVDSNPVTLTDAQVAQYAKDGKFVDYPRVFYPDISGNIELEIIAAPKVKSISRIIEEVYDAREEIVFSSFALSDQMLISALVNKFSRSADEKGYNEHPIALLPHPWDKSGIILRRNGERGTTSSQLLWEWSPSEPVPSAEALAAIQPLAQDLKTSIRSWDNYLNPSGNFKSAYKYFYAKGSAGGEIQKVHVEGIFNGKVVGAEDTLNRLKAEGLPIWQSQMNGELHNKLFIIDEKVVIFGSHNFSQAAENSNDEMTFIIKSPTLAKLIKDEYYSKTKHFALGPEPTLDYSKATVAITEILPESAYQFKQKLKTIDMGEYVELYNYGTTNVNLYGFRIDDRYFPAEGNFVPDMTANPGFSADLVAFAPAAVAGNPGTPVYDPSKTILKPKSFALVVGRYFHPSYYQTQFINNFKALNKREPKATEFPILLTVGAYYQQVIGDASQGIKAKDKIALYGYDCTTLIDRFDFPPDLHYDGQSGFLDFYASSNAGVPIERLTNQKKLVSLYASRTFPLHEIPFRLKGMTTDLIYTYRGPEGTYSQAQDWALTPFMKGGSPGTFLPPQEEKSLYHLDTRVPNFK